MSADPTEFIYYGIQLQKVDDESYEYDNEPDLDDQYYAMIQKWYEQYGPKEPETKDYDSPEWDEWKVCNLEWTQTPQNIVIDWSGTYESRTFFIECSALRKSVEWEEQIDLGDSLCSKEDQTEADVYLKEFCEKFNLPFKKPSWYLACSYF